MTEVIKVENVSKSFQDKKAVDRVSFTIYSGEIVAILGPNGAGKTTTISMILGLLNPSHGKIHVFSREPKERSVREKLGTMLQDVNVMHGLKVNELLDLVRHYYPDPLSLEELISLTALNEQDLKTRVEKLSGGQKRRLSFALALAGNPDLLVLDEPTVGMDLNSRKRFWETIQQLTEHGKTIIFSTHYLQEADDIANRILLFKEGNIIADGAPAEIKSNFLTRTVSFQADSDHLLTQLKGWSEIKNVTQKNGRFYIETNNSDAILERLFNEKTGAYDIQIEQGRLEAAFEQLTNNQQGVI
ncbi:ABC transporter ATP-binding protein [Hazenella coriacea]|uniref:ABC-2 type transport system ATP-binding protein n=1 Tax=Hazenella coriacea TaxID=1179467 RepID=A0A4R3LBB5_9BACL|nr:ABC transporter ATP-binding protein [Hazenella coriacea]TCS96588.1 ABC-2 type transport system ATP-binding protein [Hazenella coriacea]